MTFQEWTANRIHVFSAEESFDGGKADGHFEARAEINTLLAQLNAVTEERDKLKAIERANGGRITDCTGCEALAVRLVQANAERDHAIDGVRVVIAQVEEQRLRAEGLRSDLAAAQEYNRAMEMRLAQKVFCEDTGMPELNGECPIHHGDACLRHLGTLIADRIRLIEEKAAAQAKVVTPPVEPLA